MITRRPFYFSTIRNLTAAFGSLFNNINIQRFKADGSLQDCIKVPLAYASADKTIVMLQQRNPVLQKNGVDVKVVLPRMGFELTGLSYDTTRKTQTLNQITYTPPPDTTFNSASSSVVNLTNETIAIPNHTFLTGDPVIYLSNGGTSIGGLTNGTKYYITKVDANTIKLSSSLDSMDCAGAGSVVNLTSLGNGIQILRRPYARQYSPVPYNFEFSLYIFVKYIDDGLQIIEQIVPYFTPFYTVTLNDIPTYGVKRSVPISLTSILSSDEYQGDVAEDRIITWTLTFSAAGWVYPPIKDGSGVIKNADVNFIDFDGGGLLTTVNVHVDPLTANREDNYEIITTISE